MSIWRKNGTFLKQIQLKQKIIGAQKGIYNHIRSGNSLVGGFGAGVQGRERGAALLHDHRRSISSRESAAPISRRKTLPPDALKAPLQ